VIALSLFFLLFLRMHAGLGWTRIVIMLACGVGGLLFLAGVLNRDFPPGLLQEFVELPWPLGGR